MAKKIYLSPSDQDNNAYAYGGTTEAAQCCRIADALEKALKRCGFEVKNNKTSSMYQRVAESNNWGADLHMPLHTNAYNGKTSGTRIYTYDSSGKGRQAAKKVFDRLAPITPGTSESLNVADFYEIVYANAPTVYIESEFHDAPDIAKWIIEHVVDIAEAICKGVCDYFGVKYVAATAQESAKPAPAPAVPASSSVCSVSLPVLRQGDSGGHVKTLQILLNKYNGAGLTEDGEFGPATRNAVMAYQKDRKLDVDGVAGAQTWAQLLR